MRSTPNENLDVENLQIDAHAVNRLQSNNCARCNIAPVCPVRADEVEPNASRRRAARGGGGVGHAAGCAPPHDAGACVPPAARLWCAPGLRAPAQSCLNPCVRTPVMRTPFYFRFFFPMPLAEEG
ncbi:MAG: hypothetical protein MUF79_13910 [Burkholderiales bacterium]|nr:hypothetical protein [Burkholderiales bacterium]